jgi:hypothetical protein
MPTLARSNWADVNWARALVFAALLVLAFALAEPAYAFSQFESTVTSRTTEALGVATNILYVAAGLALLVGIAPMLWGQIKVKWMVSSCIAAVLFGLAPTIIGAFAG